MIGNWRYQNLVNNIFRGNFPIYNSDEFETVNKSINTFSQFLVLNTSGGKFEVPMYLLSGVEKLLIETLSSTDASLMDKIVISLYQESQPIPARTSDRVIQILYQEPMGQALTVASLNNSTYYGNRGFILDSNFNILTLYTVTCTVYKDMLNGGTWKIEYDNPTIHIGSKVFLKETPLCAHIINKLIPTHLYTSIPYFFSVARGIDGIKIENKIKEFEKPQVIISADLNKFIEKPVKPSLKMCSNEMINQFLIDNADIILQQTKCQ